MTGLIPNQIWWSPDEIAAARLPDLPTTKRGVNDLVKRLNWKGIPGAVKRNPGRGGGWLYHWSVFPAAAKRKLLKEVAPETSEPKKSRDLVWAAFEALPDRVKDKAKARLSALQLVETLQGAGETSVNAVAEAARQNGCSPRSIYDWMGLLEGVADADRLAYLAPQHGQTKRDNARAECSDEFWDYLKSDFLRPEQPSFLLAIGARSGSQKSTAGRSPPSAACGDD